MNDQQQTHYHNQTEPIEKLGSSVTQAQQLLNQQSQQQNPTQSQNQSQLQQQPQSYSSAAPHQPKHSQQNLNKDQKYQQLSGREHVKQSSQHPQQIPAQNRIQKVQSETIITNSSQDLQLIQSYSKLYNAMVADNAHNINSPSSPAMKRRSASQIDVS